MELFLGNLDYILHIDKYLVVFINDFGVGIYLLLFVVVFSETGLFMAPFLPEESLLFVTGTLASKGLIEIWIITVLLMLSNILGESFNFWIGKRFGPKIFESNHSIIFNKKHISKAENFYQHYGGKTIIIAKFIPIIRTFVPFIAGVAKVKYSHFICYNIIGGVPWVAIFLMGGYFFGTIPIVSDNFTIVILIIVLISILPGIVTTLYNRRKKIQ